ncbi:nitronate monooxygenase [Deinococcus deserti]|uniref:Propionate 3-nitronate monooxygenase n=1 Tax=Deinococcus deserti (strain DSM 17065 / CIP 109153 / LMG 22923 / VCD115) TaxID=546414 RepID=C1CUG7_DEIDV|nr:nitronate monooxygenase [Deinococcus deserti]ACO45834.1 putative 2-nitropropane dioxygenase (2-NPD) (Nitroalkane oxidase); putative membrane protein [Deinococcus deserti VCD115]
MTTVRHTPGSQEHDAGALGALGLTVPVVLAPMAGGVGTPELVAAVSGAGGLGSLGAAYLSPAQITGAMKAIRRLTIRPFAVNLFAPQPVPEVEAAQIEAACAELQPFHAALQLPPPAVPAHLQEDFEAQLEAVLAEPPAVFSFAFGRLEAQHIRALHAAGVLVVGTATSVQEARMLEADGVDAVVAQGGAAGGHRGGWEHDDLADTLELTRGVAGAVSLPVLAAGGLMTREHVRDALAAGASLAQCGTAFLLADEAGTSPPYRAALQQGGDTVLTRAFSGRTARGLRNAFSDRVAHPLPYPYQNALTRPLRSAGAQAGQADVLSLWAGEGFALARQGPATQVLEALTPDPSGTPGSPAGR